ncbi:MAG: hypothetical protein LBT12_04485 [Oscillospiraceae bacterium]|jgi:hypothetical protein|nr:hypothetical protein [Oscillospiraceae bacterium]
MNEHKELTHETVRCPDEDASLFFVQQDAERGCVGYLRGDFGRDGREFWTTWFDGQNERGTETFRAELDAVVNHLRTQGMLKDLAAMKNVCAERQDAKLRAGRGDSYGFRFDGESHSFYVRCIPHGGDYNFYITAYDRALLQDYLQARHKPEEGIMNNNKMNIHEHEFDLVEICGKPALYTVSRIDRNTVPKGWYAYDLRHGDAGTPMTAEPLVGVNRAASILTTKPFSFDSIDDPHVDIGDSLYFLGEQRRFDEFTSDYGQVQAEPELSM